jgi:hypothetical protein
MIRLLALLGLLIVTPAFGQADVVASCGSVTIKAGTPHNVTVDLNGASCRMGGGGGGGTAPTSVWNTSDAAANGMTLSNGGLTIAGPAASWGTARGTIGKTTGKYYVEFKNIVASGGGSGVAFGLATTAAGVGQKLADYANSIGSFMTGAGVLVNGGYGLGIAYAPSYLPVLNDVFGLAVDFNAGKIWISFNGSYIGGLVATPQDPVSGANAIATIIAPVLGSLASYPAISVGYNGGTWSLQATAASQTYPAPSGFVAWDTGAVSGCAEATAYLARAPGETAHAADLTTLICGLVSDGVWAKLDALYLLAQQTQADARLNLVGASYPLTGSATFTAYQGFSAFPSGGLDTGFNPNSAPSPKYTLNSATLGGWAYDTPETAETALIGNDNLSGGSLLSPNFGGLSYINVNGDFTSGFTYPGTGLFTGDRSSSALMTAYWNGVNKQTNATSTSSMPNVTITVGSLFRGAPYTTAKTISAAFISASLGGAGQLALYNRFRTYMTSVGVP